MNHNVDSLEATLEMDPRADSVVGTITGDDGVERPFSGWMELANLIEAWRTDNRPRGVGDTTTTAPRRSPLG